MERKGTLGQKFFSARVVDLWYELDDGTASVDNVTMLSHLLRGSYRKIGILSIP